MERIKKNRGKTILRYLCMFTTRIFIMAALLCSLITSPNASTLGRSQVIACPPSESAYDAVGRVASTTYPSGLVVSQSYDASGERGNVFMKRSAGSASVQLVNNVYWMGLGEALEGWQYG